MAVACWAIQCLMRKCFVIQSNWSFPVVSTLSFNVKVAVVKAVYRSSSVSTGRKTVLEVEDELVYYFGLRVL